MSNHSSNHSSRRRFLKKSSAAVAAGGFLGGSNLLITGTKASGAIDGANDRVRIAVAGLNGRGQSHIDGWMKALNVELAYVADP